LLSWSGTIGVVKIFCEELVVPIHYNHQNIASAATIRILDNLKIPKDGLAPLGVGSVPDSISDETDGAGVGTPAPRPVVVRESEDAVGDSDTSSGTSAAVGSKVGAAVGTGIGLAVGEPIGDSEGDIDGVQSTSCNGYEAQLFCRGHSFPR
jgi:hypothetical protein